MRAIRRELQIIFQDPVGSLNPRMRVGDIVGEPLRIHGVGSPSERHDRVVDLLTRVGLSADHVRLDPWNPVWSSLAFVVVVLGLSCLYIERSEF